MTSPSITKSPENQKGGNKSPTHSAPRAPSRAESQGSAGQTPAAPAARECPVPIGWLRVFKFADLMIKQGC